MCPNATIQVPYSQKMLIYKLLALAFPNVTYIKSLEGFLSHTANQILNLNRNYG